MNFVSVTNQITFVMISKFPYFKIQVQDKTKMNHSSKTINFSNTLIEWYNQNKRDLPWRDISDPYKIWISEIILQQTRVNQGLNYYLRFIESFPNIKSLAKASEDEVLKHWQGLGYYSRARNIHKAAKQVESVFNGNFPNNYNEIISLAGIGEYTAAAISAFAFNLAHAVVDGNVYRVLSRIYGIDSAIDSSKGKKEFAELAQKLLNQNNPAMHNQAIMEFGALQCTPTNPNCETCPFTSKCEAYKFGLINQLPVKLNKIKTSNRFFNYLFIEKNGITFLQKRNAKDIWQNLYEFPLIETTHLLNEKELSENENFRLLFADISNVEITKKTNPMKHVLSHRVIFAQFISIKITETSIDLETLIQVPIVEIDKFATSRLMELFLENQSL